MNVPAGCTGVVRTRPSWVRMSGQFRYVAGLPVIAPGTVVTTRNMGAWTVVPVASVTAAVNAALTGGGGGRETARVGGGGGGPCGGARVGIAQVEGSVPPVAVSVTEYGVPTVPGGSAELVVIARAAVTVMDRFAVAVFGTASVTVNV